MNKEKMQDLFDEFEVEIPMLIQDLEESLKNSKKYTEIKFSFDIELINTIESFYLDVLNKQEDTIFSSNHFDRVILAYLGETLIHHAGGNWKMSTDDDFTFGTPVISGFKYDYDKIGFSPVGIRDNFINNKVKGSFKKSLEYCINKKEIEEDLMEQMKNLPRPKNKK